MKHLYISLALLLSAHVFAVDYKEHQDGTARQQLAKQIQQLSKTANNGDGCAMNAITSLCDQAILKKKYSNSYDVEILDYQKLQDLYQK